MADAVSALVLPSIVLIASFILAFGRGDMFSAFSEGVKRGLHGAVSIIPSMVLLICALSMFRVSGAARLIADVLAPLGEKIGIPSELFVLIVSRPFSGGAASASFAEIIKSCGADSFEAFAAAVIMSSSDTLVYIICIYFSVTRATKTRYAIPCAVAVMLFSLFVSLIVARIFFF